MMLWSMESKAAERSRRQRQDNFCDPMAMDDYGYRVRLFQLSDACSRQTGED